MHNAPPVVFPVGRFVWGRWVMLALALLGGVGLLWHPHFPVLQVHPWALSAWGLLLLAALWATRADHWQTGSLVWTGELWLWRDPQDHEWEVSLQVVLDTGSALGLALTPQRSGVISLKRFVWFSQGDLPVLWHGFRCAVYSPAFNGPKSTTSADGVY
jgi:hypothetical protein